MTTIATIAYSAMMLPENGWQEYCGDSDTYGPIQVVFPFIPLGLLVLDLCVLKYASESLQTVRPDVRSLAGQEKGSGAYSSGSGLNFNENVHSENNSSLEASSLSNQ